MTRRDEFLSRFHPSSPQGRIAANRLLDAASDAGAIFEWGSQGVSIRVMCSVRTEPITLAWLYPPGIERGWMRTRNFSFGAGNGNGNGRMFGMDIPSELSYLLERWCDQFESDLFTEDASSKGVVAYSVNPNEASRHIDLLEARLRKVVSDLKAF